ncbi:hypothetical protein F7P05_23765 [Klebsiella pneumoniae]|nr:hypothetical protein F7P09_23645 [Klebsiella pneumoniae]QGV97958.1 hypothetical protein F7P05_23765 [Klebsiella pneumoniae]
MNDYLDSVSTKIYYQHTEAHDWTYMPDSVTRRMQTVNSNYDTDTGACRLRWRKPRAATI